MNKKPAYLKILEGNPGKRSLKNEPKPIPLKPACPKWLPARAKRIFREIAPQLERLGLLTRIDGPSLGDYSLCLFRLQECEQDIQTRGLLVPGDRGLVKNPSSQLAREYRSAAQKWAQRFGLDPLSRSALDVEPGNSPDEMEKLLTGLK